MALFQKSVLRKFLNDLDKIKLQEAWSLFKDHFHNADVQKHIWDSKEEEYQEGFVRDLFVKVLGYTLKPQPNYNLVLEKKTEADATKSDGAMLRGETVTGVIELKDTDTTELDSIEKQVFGYKHKHKNCVYVITSNFEKLRFYINDSIEYEEFDLFNLTENEFALLYLCLQQKNIENDVPLKIKQASVAEEEGVTKKLYAEYSSFRQQLFTNIAALNPQYNKLEIFQKTQKLLDRFLFILFAEDRLLVPPNSVRVILEDWEKLKDLDHYVPLYERFKKYFGYLNKGHAGKHYDIYAYNGGLFADDEILDNIKVDDKLLFEGTKALSNYDFQSEVDVNILGHIFEHSLSEIEEVQAELEGKAVEKTKTRRKKDGVFYTPRYITKYIVENTVGELCRQKKEELKITDDEFAYRKRKDARENKLKKLDVYRKWLLELTICDPACGSGAFLNQALEFLIAEHRYIDELRAKLLGEKMVMNDMETEILSHNLFGVDINEEAVEIARLSLWLRTAQKGRKLSDLSKSIKCGNSLIDDPAIAGDKAFNWQKEFPQIFKEGGFDVVIGNPPYGAKFSENEKKYVKEKFTYSTEGKIDSYRIFYQKGFEIMALNGIISYITPNTFLYNVQSKPLRKEILTNLRIHDAVELRKNIFEDAPDVVTVILVMRKAILEQYEFRARVAFHNVHYKDINMATWEIDQFINIQNLRRDPAYKINLRAITNFNLIKQRLETFAKLGDYFNLRQGTKPYGVKEGKEVELLAKTKYDESWEKAINGRNISQYYINYENDYVQRSEELHSVLSKEIIGNEKIYFQRMRKISLFPRIISCYDSDSIHGLYTCSVIFKKDAEMSLKYALCIINSKLINIWYKNFDTDIEIKLDSVKQIPFIKGTLGSQAPFIEKADIMLSKTKELQQAKKQLLQLITSKHEDLNINKKLEDWPSLSFKDFLKELTKQKIKLSLAEQTEWMQHFENEKAKANAIKKTIDDTDKEIDQMVYKLYELKEEEIKIVEGN